MKVALVGFGYWGPNLARNIAETDGLELAAIADHDPARLALAARRHPLADCSPDADIAACDAVVVATPVSTHYALARRALGSGQHVLIAKPLAQTLAQALELQALAAEQSVLLMTDHTFVHTGAVKTLRALRPTIGEPLYYDSVRVNLGLFQRDTDVVWDLAPHDLSIVRSVFPTERPVEVACVAEDRTRNGQADVAWLTVWHASGFVAHTHLSWLSPVKVRRALIAGDRTMIVYDDMEPSEKVRAYDTGVRVQPGPETHAALVDYRTGDCVAPHLDFREALAAELDLFASMIERERDAAPVRALLAADGVAVVRLLEAADVSRANGGCRVPVAGA